MTIIVFIVDLINGVYGSCVSKEGLRDVRSQKNKVKKPKVCGERRKFKFNCGLLPLLKRVVLKLIS